VYPLFDTFAPICATDGSEQQKARFGGIVLNETGERGVMSFSRGKTQHYPGLTPFFVIFDTAKCCPVRAFSVPSRFDGCTGDIDRPLFPLHFVGGILHFGAVLRETVQTKAFGYLALPVPDQGFSCEPPQTLRIWPVQPDLEATGQTDIVKQRVAKFACVCQFQGEEHILVRWVGSTSTRPSRSWPIR
jgi:hypothetical protein